MTKKRKATGTLGCLLENVDEEQLELCRRRVNYPRAKDS